MAVVDVQENVSINWRPFNTPPQNFREYSIIPRAQLRCIAEASVPAKAAPDVSQIEFLLNLPVNFAYRLVSSQAAALGNAAGDDVTGLHPIGSCFITDGSAGVSGSDEVYAWATPPALDVGGSTGESWAPYFTIGTALRKMMVFSLVNFTDVPLVADQTAQIQIDSRFVDDSATTSPLFTFFYELDFLVYDVNQAQNVVMNTPVPVI